MKHSTRHRIHLACVVLAAGAVGLHVAGLLVGVAGAVVCGGLFWLAKVAETRIDVRDVPGRAARLHARSRAAKRSARGGLVVAVSGPLTFLAQGAILRALGDRPWPAYVVLDLSAVSFIDAGGMTEVANATDFLAARGTRVVIAASRVVREAVGGAALRSVTRAAGVFTDVDDALGAVPGAVYTKPAPRVLPQAAGWA